MALLRFKAAAAAAKKKKQPKQNANSKPASPQKLRTVVKLKDLNAKKAPPSQVQRVPARPAAPPQEVTVRLRFRRKLSPMLIKLIRGTKAASRAEESSRKEAQGEMPSLQHIAKTHVLHLLLERRWLGLDEKTQRKSLGNRSFTAPVLEGWGVRVHAVFKSQAKAEKALAAALAKRNIVEREGGLRERVQLMVKTCDVFGQPGEASMPEPGHPAWVDGSLTRRVYVVTSSVGESFSNTDLAPGLVEFEGNYFYTSAEEEEEAKRLEEQRGSPWGYPHNAGVCCSKPGEVMAVFSSPIAEGGANAYATGQGLRDLQVPGLTSLQNHDLGKAITYTKEGCAHVKLLRAGKEGSIRVFVQVNEHSIVDCNPRPPASPSSGKKRKL
eukprot:TRINITY_DN34081_c0_g1_i1.p1 TRINITY_DN34081_c0_g1~~TRINITY_DN34081_c0_g1_i1.p1  ORF type:complete len:382 (-),score=92.33 TRINITY_DN34081_c0_g1_i1:96-1241(-)